MLNEMECDCRIRLKDTNYKETNYVLLEPDSYDECVQIYIKYCQYKQFGDMIPLFKEEFTLDIADRIGYIDNNNRLCAFSVIWKLPSVNSLYTSYFAWDYENPELRIGNKSVRSEIARYKRLGYEYYYLGPAMPYKKQLQGYEIADVSKTFKFQNNHIIWH